MIANTALLVVTLGGILSPTILATIEPTLGPDQEVIYRSGTPLIISRGKDFDVALAPMAGPTGRYKIGKRLFLVVTVRSRSDRNVEVSEASFTVTGNSERAKVMRAIELEDSIVSDAGWLRVLGAIVSVADFIGASSAGKSTTHGHAHSSVRYPNGDRGTVSTNYSGTTYNHGQADAARRAAARDAEARMQAISAKEREQLDQVSTVLQRNTLLPGEEIKGLVVVELPRSTACPTITKRRARVNPGARDLDDFQTVEDREDGPCRVQVTLRVGGETHLIDFEEVVPRVADE